MKIALLLLLSGFVFWPSLTQAQAMKQESTFQGGFEYDTNVFKNFTNPSSDFLFRILGKNQGQWEATQKLTQSWNLQLGGKKYFSLSEQDTFIGSLELPVKYYFSPAVLLVFNPEAKYQNESDSVDPSTDDINEDFFSSNGLLSAYFYFSDIGKWQVFSGLNYFKFKSNNSFSYLREWTGTKISRELTDWLSAFFQYYYARQQFESSDRSDAEHALTSGIQFQKGFIFTGSYTYQTVDSSNQIFSFDNHRINLSLSVPLLMPDDETVEPLLGIHLLGTLQIKNYPSIFGSTQEGERFLLSGSEDENFNSITAKLTYHPVSAFTLEGKFTRYSNELSSSQVDFTRHLFYVGGRYSF